MTNHKIEARNKDMGAGGNPDEDEKREEASDEKAEATVKLKTAEMKEQATRRRVSHNRG